MLEPWATVTITLHKTTDARLHVLRLRSKALPSGGTPTLLLTYEYGQAKDGCKWDQHLPHLVLCQCHVNVVEFESKGLVGAPAAAARPAAAALPVLALGLSLKLLPAVAGNAGQEP